MSISITAVSDLHGELPTLPGANVTIIAGDVCPVINHALDRQTAWLSTSFTHWLNGLDTDEIILIAGNHDFIAEEDDALMRSLPCHYLKNEAIELLGTKFWGSPYTPQFGHWAFMREDRHLRDTWERIPDDTEVLITHGPPHGILDVSSLGNRHAGSASLGMKLHYAKPSGLKLMVFGHIHEGYGVETVDDVMYANVALNNSMYRPVNKPVRLRLIGR